MSELSSLEAKRANKLQKVLWHGASPHRWSLRGASIDSPHFLGGCYMTPSARLASMYCADWTARPDKRDFIQLAIREVFAFGDPEELLALGFIVETDDSTYCRTDAANADYVLSHWSHLKISHCLIRPQVHTLHSYPTGAVIFPMRVRTQNVLFIDCEGNNFDSLPGRLLNAGEHHLSTDDVVKTLKGKHDAVWFENITDSVHITMEEPTDVVFVYSPRHMAFAITGESPADLMCDSVVVK